MERPKEEKGVHVAQRNGFRPFYLARAGAFPKPFGKVAVVTSPGQERRERESGVSMRNGYVFAFYITVPV